MPGLARPLWPGLRPDSTLGSIRVTPWLPSLPTCHRMGRATLVSQLRSQLGLWVSHWEQKTSPRPWGKVSPKGSFADPGLCLPALLGSSLPPPAHPSQESQHHLTGRKSHPPRHSHGGSESFNHLAEPCLPHLCNGLTPAAPTGLWGP